MENIDKRDTEEFEENLYSHKNENISRRKCA